ncbi:MAG: hypothetical protein V4674_04505 [Patescibacteria group bacterium]
MKLMLFVICFAVASLAAGPVQAGNNPFLPKDDLNFLSDKEGHPTAVIKKIEAGMGAPPRLWILAFRFGHMREYLGKDGKLTANCAVADLADVDLVSVPPVYGPSRPAPIGGSASGLAEESKARKHDHPKAVASAETDVDRKVLLEFLKKCSVAPAPDSTARWEQAFWNDKGELIWDVKHPFSFSKTDLVLVDNEGHTIAGKNCMNPVRRAREQSASEVEVVKMRDANEGEIKGEGDKPKPKPRPKKRERDEDCDDVVIDNVNIRTRMLRDGLIRVQTGGAY